MTAVDDAPRVLRRRRNVIDEEKMKANKKSVGPARPKPRRQPAKAGCYRLSSAEDSDE